MYFNSTTSLMKVYTGISWVNTPGIATGGTVGQVLAKLSSTNYDTTWVSLTGGLVYLGTWNASTNTPTLTSGTGTTGGYYVVSTSGSTNLDGVTDWVIGDWAIFNGSFWQKIDQTNLVTSVAGRTGNVVLANTDVSGLGTMSVQNSNSVSVTGGSITGITDLAVADGGTGASDASGARSNLGVTGTGADTTYAFRANNLSDLADATTARANLGLGTAATTNSTAYATAAQGAKADTAVQTITSTDGSIVVTPSGTTINLAVSEASPASTLLTAVRNTTGATLTKGTAVYISGATGQISTVSKALATSDATSAQTLGLITADISNNSNGYVTVIGLITNINTSAYTDGAQLYLSPTTAGTLTATKPYAPQHLVYVAIVEHAHPSQGKLFVRVQNGYEMDELHNVSAQSPTTGQTLVYNASNSLWEKNTVSLTAGVNGVLPTANGGTNLSSFTSGGVVYASSSSALATGSALTWNGTTFAVSGAVTGDSFKKGDVGNFIIGGGSGGTTFLDSGSATDLVFRPAGTEAMRLTSSSLYTASGINVGFGTSNMGARLSVVKAITGGNIGTSFQQEIVNDNGVNLGDWTGTVYRWLPNNANTNQAYIGAIITSTSTNTLSDLVFGVKNSSADVAITEAMRIKQGNVGIGTNNPTEKLVVNGNVRLLGGSYLQLFNSTNASNSGFATDATGLLQFSSTSVTRWLNNTLAVEQMRLDASGNLQLSTASTGILASDGYTMLNQTPTVITVGATNRSLAFATSASATAAILDNTGNLGLGVTPSAWLSGSPALQLKYKASVWNHSDLSLHITQNAYFDGEWKRENTSQPTNYYQYQGQHIWRTAAGGTAGTAFTFAEAMILDGGGNLFLGASSLGSNANYFGFSPGNAFADFGHGTGVASGTPYTRFLFAGSSIGSIEQNGTTGISIGGSSQLVFNVASTEKGRFTSTGLNVTGAITENNVAVVTQSDIGTGANEIPLNQYLGSMAYQDGSAYYNTGMTTGFRNRIINGDMRIDQRNAGASFGAINAQYSLDRWQAWSYQSGAITGVFTVQQNGGSFTPPDGFVNYLAVVSTYSLALNSTTICAISQSIEGNNFSDFAWGTANAKPITISFWVRSSLTGTFGGSLENSNGNRAYAFNYIINTANVWEQKYVTISGDTTGTWDTGTSAGVRLSFGLGGGSGFAISPNQWRSTGAFTALDCVSVVSTAGASWCITGVQLEKGNIATPFDVRPYGTELTLCQRYFQKISGFLCSTGATGLNTCATSVMFKTEMRTAPTVGLTSALIVTQVNTGDYAQTSASVTIAGGGSRVTTLGVNAAFDNFYTLPINSPLPSLVNSGVLTLSAEL
jgi:hypothetical protein